MSSPRIPLLVVALVATSCVFDPVLPPEALLTCSSDEGCPGEQKCLVGHCHDRSETLPSIVVATVSVNEDASQSVPLTAIGAAPELLRVEVLEAPARGTLTCADDVVVCATGCADVALCDTTSGSVTYTPTPDESGEDSFVVRVSRTDSPTLVSEPTRIPIEILSAADAPEIVEIVTENDDVLQGASVSFEVRARDADGDVLFIRVDDVENGVVTRLGEPVTDRVPLLGPAGEPIPLTFTADTDAEGDAVIAIEVSDADDPGAFGVRAEILLPILLELRVDGTEVTIAEDATATFALAGQGEGGVIFAIASEGGPSHGVASIAGDTLTYTPTDDFFGRDCFEIVGLANGAVSAPAELCVTVTPVNDPPTATVPPLFLAREDASIEINLGSFVSDVDGDTVTCQVDANDTPELGTASVAVGTLTLTYAPLPDAAGPEEFGVTCTDGLSEPIRLELVVNVQPVNDAPVCEGCATTIFVTEDVLETINLAELFSDAEEQALACTIVTPPALGAAQLVGTSVLLYQPNPDANGTDTLGVVCSDGAQASPPSIIQLSIEPVNDAPICSACASPIVVQEDSFIDDDLQLRLIDIEGDPIASCAIVEPPLLGDVTLDGTAWRYTPEPDVNGPDSLSVVCEDDDGATTDTFELQIDIAAVPDVGTVRSIDNGPVFADGEVPLDTDEDAELFFIVSGEDPDGEPVVFEWRDPDLGAGPFAAIPPSSAASLDVSLGQVSVLLSQDDLAVVRFKPRRDSNGAQRIEVRAAPGPEDTEAPPVVPLLLTIRPVNDPPVGLDIPPVVVFVHDVGASSRIAEVQIPIASIARDVDGDPLIVNTFVAPRGRTASGVAGVGLLARGAGDVLRFLPTEEFIDATATIEISDGIAAPVLHTLSFEGHGFEDCATIRNRTGLTSGPHLLDPGAPGDADLEVARFFAHCEMESLGGGWTLVARALGGDGALAFDAETWRNAVTQNSARSDYEFSSARLASGHATELNEILVGMQNALDERPRLIHAELDLSTGTASELASLQRAHLTSKIPLVTRTATGTDAEVRERWLGLVDATDEEFPPGCNEVALRGQGAPGTTARVGILFSDTDCTDPNAFVGLGSNDTVTAGGVAPGFTATALGAIWVRGTDFSDDEPERATCEDHAIAGVKLDGTYPLVGGGACFQDFPGNDSICRDGILEEGEECDDGNGADGDLCDSNCTAPRCGNGIISVDENGAAETCDPPDPVDGIFQSCSGTCQIIGGSS